jgi:hypothetical protein
MSILIFNMIYNVSINKESYFTRFDRIKYERIYAHSQYNAGINEFLGNIDDPELYSLAGIKYLEFTDPSFINYETQPLTKYFYGLSILFTGSAVWIQLISGILCLVITFLISRLLFSSNLFALFPSIILSFDLLFREQLTKPYLDLFQTFTIELFIYLLLLSVRKNKISLTIMIVAGISALSKSFSTGILLFGTGFLFLLIRYPRLIKQYLVKSVFMVITYLIGYSVYFLSHDFKDFILLHIKILRMYKSYVPEYPKGEIFRIIFSGYWRKWFDDFGFDKVAVWSLLWPLGFISLIYTLIRKKFYDNPEMLLLCIWSVLYLIFISTRLVFPRYLMPVLPFMYIMIVYSGVSIIGKKGKAC